MPTAARWGRGQGHRIAARVGLCRRKPTRLTLVAVVVVLPQFGYIGSFALYSPVELSLAGAASTPPVARRSVTTGSPSFAAQDVRAHCPSGWRDGRGSCHQ